MKRKRDALQKACGCVALLLFVLISSPTVQAEEALTLWVHPYLPVSDLLKRFSPLAAYLTEKTGVPISVKVQEDYKSHIKATGSDKADIAYLGPVSYVKVTEGYGKKPLLAKLVVRGKSVFYGVIIVRKDSAIHTVEDFARRSFAFGDPNSTMSYLVPRYMLLQAGVGIEDLGKYDFLSSHQNVALGVLGGYFDGGGVMEEVFHEYKGRGLRMLAKSSPIAEHVFVTRASLPPAMREILQKAMMDLNSDTRGPDILMSIKKTATGFASATDKDYDSLRNILASVGE